jgi:restriction endonuclease S subunit
MSSYTISKSLNPKRVFILQKSELEKRFDPFFYVPELLELEKKVLAKKPRKLRDYVVSVSSGATPKTTESELYYAEKENGIPFLRVQNLSPTGVLEFDDCKYINHETHNGMLKRSQVSAGDLLVKITGVGRMAIASVAPEEFIGNINQHVCVIKTGSKEISETLAAFLNSDIGEKLASRRSAGGTRPALDYPALLSIPIIEDNRILKITAKVIEQKQKNEAEAEKLLSSVDEYLLKELGIKLPLPPENTLKSRMFISTLKAVANNRLDPKYYSVKYANLQLALDNSKYKFQKIRAFLSSLSMGISTPEYKSEITDVPFILGKNLKKGYLDLENLEFISSEINKANKSSIIRENDILFSVRGVYIGKVAVVPKEIEGANIINNIVKFTLKDIDPHFVVAYLNSTIGQEFIYREVWGGAQPGFTNEQIKSFPIPIPPLDKQKDIANHITDIRNKAQQLKDKTKELLRKASEEIEEILLK